MSLLDLNGIKALFAKGLDHAKQTFPEGLFSVDHDLCDYQLSLVNKAQDLTTLMNAIAIRNVTLSTAYDGPKPVCSGCEIQYNPVQFGVGNSGWYFNYGVAGNLSFVFSLGRIEIAPPKVVREQGLPPSEAVRWGLGGGIGIGDTWYNFPAEIIYMNYAQPSYSTFSLVGSGNTLKNVTLQNAQANSLLPTANPLQFSMSATFTSPTDNKEHSMSVTMISNTPPVPNVPNSCGGCSDNLGSLYYSYTDMDIILTIDGAVQTGKGWIDHQLLKTGVPRGLMAQAQASVINTLLRPVSGGWLWFAIQDYESDTQYMLCHFFASKFYKDDIKMNEDIPMQLVNVYKKGVTHFKPTRTDMSVSDLKVKMVKTINVNGLALPATYNITLPGGKNVVLTLASSPDQYLTPYGSYENPALLYGADDLTKPIGIGIIEANGYFTNDEYAQRYISSAGGDANDSRALALVSRSVSPNIHQTGWQRFLSFMVFLIPLWILIMVLIYVLYSRSNRNARFMVMVAVLLLFYGLYY
jgi:hypothetical protein